MRSRSPRSPWGEWVTVAMKFLSLFSWLWGELNPESDHLLPRRQPPTHLPVVARAGLEPAEGGKELTPDLT